MPGAGAYTPPVAYGYPPFPPPQQLQQYYPPTSFAPPQNAFAQPPPAYAQPSQQERAYGQPPAKRSRWEPAKPSRSPVAVHQLAIEGGADEATAAVMAAAVAVQSSAEAGAQNDEAIGRLQGELARVQART